MPRRAAIITQADVARTVRAAKQAGADNVELRPDGTIIVHLHASGTTHAVGRPLEPKKEIVL